VLLLNECLLLLLLLLFILLPTEPGNFWIHSLVTTNIRNTFISSNTYLNDVLQMDHIYIITNKLTPWNTVPLENLAVTELVKKFPAFYGTRGFIKVFATARHWSLF
jgi:hypothetical protein